jgi:hypothetical protein
MCLRFMFLLTTRLAAWLLLARHEETWKTAEILILRHQLAVLQRRQPRRPRLDWADRALLATLFAVIPKDRRHGCGCWSPCGCRQSHPRHATRRYSLIVPPTRVLSLPKIYPCWSGGMVVLVENAAEAVPSADVTAGVAVWLGNRRRQWAQWPGVRNSLMRPVGVVKLLELAQCVQEVPLVPDQGPVEQFAAAGQHPPFCSLVVS